MYIWTCSSDPGISPSFLGRSDYVAMAMDVAVGQHGSAPGRIPDSLRNCVNKEFFVTTAPWGLMEQQVHPELNGGAYRFPPGVVGVSLGGMSGQFEGMITGGVPSAHPLPPGTQPSLAPSTTQLIKHNEHREHLAKS
ncbi:C-terminal-binding protein 2 [Triplophysa rosa]|uniref:C-terminal-binding protein 2 n=1 Tax=Triplophysa rosa TaxID=992332 RepID=A0A9W7WMK1_TRIRA|nr:C-terminal-binding protein 2 [Triplophysa rosa]